MTKGISIEEQFRISRDQPVIWQECMPHDPPKEPVRQPYETPESISRAESGQPVIQFDGVDI